MPITEQVLIDFVIDENNALEKAIEQLVRLGTIDQNLANSFKATTAEVNKQAQGISSIGAAITKQTQGFQVLNSALKPTVASLEGLTLGFQKQAQATASIRQASVELARESAAIKSVTDNAKPATVSLQELSVSAKNLSKDMTVSLQQGITEALEQAGVSLEEFNQQLAQVSSKTPFAALNKSLTATAIRIAETSAAMQKLRDSGGVGTEAFVKLEKQLIIDQKELSNIEQELTKISSSDASFENITTNTQKASVSTASLRTELRKLTEQIVAAKLSGNDIGAEYEALVAKAGNLKDAISDVNQEIANTASDTSNIDGLIGAAQGIAGAFSIAQGATALFGEESEDLQKALLKVNAVMAITQGLQSVGNALQKESAAMRFLDSSATKAQVVAQKVYNLVVGQSTGALKLFRIALASTGIGLLVIALGALIANWDKVKEAIGGVSDAQKELVENTGFNAEGAEDQLAAMEDQEEVMKRQGKTEKEILEAKVKQVDQIIEYREQQLQAQIETTRGQVEAAQRNKDILKGIINFLTIPLQGLVLAVNKIAEFFGSDFRLPDIGETISSMAFNPDDVREAGEKDIAETQKIIDKLKNQRAGFENGLTEVARAANEQRLKDQVTHAERMLLAAEVGSKKELELNKKLLIAKANLDLNGAKSAEERKLITAQLHDDLLVLEANFQKAQIDLKIKGIEAQLNVVEEGSREELRLKQQLIGEQAAAELTDVKISEAQKNLIRKKALDDQLKLQRDFNKALAREAIDEQISRNNTELNSLKINDEDRLLLTLSNIELQSEAEVAAANGNAAKIKEIYATRDQQIRDAKVAFIQQAAEFEIEAARLAGAGRRSELEKTAGSERKSFDDRIEATQELTNIDLTENAKRVDALSKQKKILPEQEFNRQYALLAEERRKIEEKNAQDILKIEEDKNKARIEVAFAAAHAIADTFALIADAQAARDQERIDGMKRALADEIEAGAITEKEALQRQKRIDAEERKAKTKAAQNAKTLAIFNSIINTAQAVVQALASAPPPFNFILAGIVGAMGLAQTAAIASRPIPKFKTGKKHQYEGFAEVAEDNKPEIIEQKEGRYLVKNKSVVWLNKTDKVYTNRESMQILQKERQKELESKTYSYKEIEKILIGNTTTKQSDHFRLLEKLQNKIYSHKEIMQLIQKEKLYTLTAVFNTSSNQDKIYTHQEIRQILDNEKITTINSTKEKSESSKLLEKLQNMVYSHKELMRIIDREHLQVLTAVFENLSTDKSYTHFETAKILKEKPQYVVNKEVMSIEKSTVENLSLKEAVKAIQKVEKAISKLPIHNISFDEKGMSRHTQEGLSLTHYNDKRYNFK